MKMLLLVVSSKDLTQAKISEPMIGLLMEYMDHAMLSEELLLEV
jgi:hypothetical protein